MRVLIVTKDIGGQIATTPTVENYPAIDYITGPDLARNMMDQAVRWGAEVVYDEVTSLEKKAEKNFVITGHKATYTGKSLLLAYGKTPRNLDVPGEREYAGRGVSYCVTCDAPLFKNREVAVVGGGNSAMEGALILAKVCKKVYLIHRRGEFRGEAVILEQIKNEPKIELVLSSATKEVLGDGKYATGIRVANVDTEVTQDITVDGIFVEIGFIVNSALIRGLVDLDRMNQVITNKRMETSNPGVFAAGDITDSPYKQAVISAGEGAAAALTAYSYVNDGAPAGVDWS
jgi:thioredoxin reductase (NADPH)